MAQRAVRSGQSRPGQQDRWQRDEDGLGGEGEGVECGRAGKRRPAARRSVAIERDQGRVATSRGQERLLLGDPGHRLYLERMHGEEQAHEPGERHAEAVQQADQERRGDPVEQEVRHVVEPRGGGHSLPLKPEQRIGERVIVHALGREPKPPGAVGGPHQRVVGEVEPVVVPDQCAVPSRQTDDDRRQGGSEPLPGGHAVRGASANHFNSLA